MSSSLFDFMGFAARTDLENEDWKVLFGSLEREQSMFLKNQNEFRSKEYKWPRDPLHTWSRLWEYPYVYHHLQRIQEQSPNEKLKVLDFGSGVTFFPFSVAQLGYDVICADIDPVCAVDIPAAEKVVRHTPGSVNVALIKNGVIPVESASQDVVYCISVLEHIPNFESVIDEIHRVLKPSGQFILTVDIDLRGNFDLGVDGFERLQTKLDKDFTKKLPERPVHPCNLLTTANSPYDMKSRSLVFLIKQLVKSALRGQVITGDMRVGNFLTVYSTVFQKELQSPSSNNVS